MRYKHDERERSGFMRLGLWPAVPAASVAAFMLLAGAAGANAPAAEPVKGPVLVAEVDSGRVIEHRDALRPWYPASTTKLMTIYVTFRAIQAGRFTLQSPVTISSRAAAEPSSKMGFEPDTVLTLDNALKIMMVKSANDIAMAVAETVGGSKEGFATLMNVESRRLGMTRSKWVNPHGLPEPGQVTTARDMAVLARALLTEFPQHRDFYKLHALQYGNTVLENFNPLLTRYPGANGMKTGFICASGYNLVASARRGNREIIAVVFGEYGGDERAERAAELLDVGFQAPPAPAGAMTTLANVASGQAFAAPLDMRPYVCSPDKARTAADSARPRARPVAASAEAGDWTEPTSHLGPPVDLGPPIPISVLVSGEDLAPGKPGFVARLPKPRPTLASDQQAGPAETVAPVVQAAEAGGNTVDAVIGQSPSGEVVQTR
jgi:D-alanyl-D-alanine carboxypeptidase